MKKKRRIKPVFLIFFILIGIILLDFLVNWLFAEKIPRDRTIKYHLEQQTADASAHRGKDEADREITG